jgi:ribosomal protein S18 acetylase RimI-like enzyme
MSPVRVEEVGPAHLALYASIPISFRVESLLRVETCDRGLGGITLTEEPVTDPFTRNYDQEPDSEDSPVGWPKRFDVTRWGFLLAMEDDRPIGGATIAYDTPEVRLLEGRRDLALLWDIRVAPDQRGRGVGSALLCHAAAWARARGCDWLKIETQNTNVRACRFYLKQGCELGGIQRHAYAEMPYVEETMLLWYLDLRGWTPKPVAGAGTTESTHS